MAASADIHCSRICLHRYVTVSFVYLSMIENNSCTVSMAAYNKSTIDLCEHNTCI